MEKTITPLQEVQRWAAGIFDGSYTVVQDVAIAPVKRDPMLEQAYGGFLAGTRTRQQLQETVEARKTHGPLQIVALYENHCFLADRRTGRHFELKYHLDEDGRIQLDR